MNDLQIFAYVIPDVSLTHVNGEDIERYYNPFAPFATEFYRFDSFRRVFSVFFGPRFHWEKGVGRNIDDLLAS